MSLKIKLVIAGIAAYFFGGLEGWARPDYYVSGFYTRTSAAAYYMDQGGALDPFYVPVKNWAFLPRVTLEYRKEDNFFMTDTDRQVSSSLNLVPGALLMYGRPEHNHLYSDASVRLPLTTSGPQNEGLEYEILIGGVKKTAKSQIYGRVGHRRLEGNDVVVGGRVVELDYVGDIGVEHRISSKSSLGANGSVEFHDYDNTDYINYDRYYGAGRFYHRMTAKSEWFLQAGMGRDDMASQKKGVYGDAVFYDVSLGMRGKPTPKTIVFGRVGYRWRTFDDGTINDVANWIANIGGDVTPFGFSTFTAEVITDLRPDITGNGDTVVDHRGTLGVNRRLFTDRLVGNASVMLGMTDYYGQGNRYDDDYWGFDLGLDWWTRWNLSVGAAYSYTERLGNENHSSYDFGEFILRMSWNY